MLGDDAVIAARDGGLQAPLERKLRRGAEANRAGALAPERLKLGRRDAHRGEGLRPLRIERRQDPVVVEPGRGEDGGRPSRDLGAEASRMCSASTSGAPSPAASSRARATTLRASRVNRLNTLSSSPPARRRP